MVPLIRENEHESNRFGYHVTCGASPEEVFVRVEISPVATVAIKGMRLMVWDENDSHLDLELKGVQQKDGTMVLSLSLPRAWAGRSELGVFSRYYDGCASGIDFGGYSVCFNKILQR